MLWPEFESIIISIMPALTVEQIDQLAVLARLEMSPSEKRHYTRQLSVVLDYVDSLREVDTNAVAETCQVTGLEDVYREDEVVECGPETRKKLLALFPERVGDWLRVGAVFDASQ